MNIIKLDAIGSTNLFLKDLSKNKEIENFTVVTAEEQFSGKGQMDTTWYAERGKNLLFTVYVDLKGLPIDLTPYISYLTALQIKKVMDKFLESSSKIKIKWPNDILSYNDKIAGVLIENSISKNKVVASFIGVGLNVNQEHFPSFLPKASSMMNIAGTFFDRDAILKEILTAFKAVMSVNYIKNHQHKIKQSYLEHLYKLQTPAMFEDLQSNVFMAKIIGVDNKGLLLLETDQETIKRYNFKAIKFL